MPGKLLSMILVCLAFIACGGGHARRDVSVAFHDVPFVTEKNLRIGFMLKTWDFKREGLELRRVEVLDAGDGAVLLTMTGDGLPKVYADPQPVSELVAFDKLEACYMAIQLPVPLWNVPPKEVCVRVWVEDPKTGATLVAEGGRFRPRTSESPMVIASPLKGNNLAFLNQSTSAYHFDSTVFAKGRIWDSEHYAFDSLQYGPDSRQHWSGDPALNASYYNYGQPVFAAAAGTVVRVVDGQPDNNGNVKTVVLDSLDAYGGNFVIQDLGGGVYAAYCHLIPGSLKVKAGDRIAEGQQLGLLGNSGNSDMPHLHFQLMDAPDLFFARAVPFRLRNWTAVGSYDEETGLGSPSAPVPHADCMMEKNVLFRVD